MIRLFAPPTSDLVLHRNAVTAANLLLHLLAAAALFAPLRDAVRVPLLDRQVVYLVPPDRHGKPDRQRGDLHWDTPALTAGAVARGAHAVAPSEAIVARGDVPAFSATDLLGAPPTAPRVRSLDAVTELEVDSTVARDPTSAAPVFPASLLKLGVEGTAAVRYIVDTLGVVDTLSYRVLTTTHPEFAVAVRRALPEMHFRPAVRHGHRVRQWVEQTFHFRIVTRDTQQTGGDPEPSG